MGQDQDRQRAQARRQVRLYRLHRALNFIIRAWQSLPLNIVGAFVSIVIVVLYFGPSNVLKYTPNPVAIYHFFFPVKHGCSLDYDFKTHGMVWADDHSPVVPPMAGYRWDVWKCDWVRG